ncbi:PadR family transcriptional regulator [Caviibacter abscessus]|uniref:PadR family transcriptional regulator n=1 Tax=Caviibacter abscessus TaxID=1766719 RepID=UPI00083981E8|nr:PadR family transcriptional regulator [Caviibacter abscessus]
MQLTSDFLELCVLSSLVNDDLYGYILTQSLQNKINISESTLYPVLRRLKSKDFVSFYDKNYQGRNRRYYKITENGLEELKRYITEWKELQQQINSFLKEANL